MVIFFSNVFWHFFNSNEKRGRFRVNVFYKMIVNFLCYLKRRLFLLNITQKVLQKHCFLWIMSGKTHSNFTLDVARYPFRISCLLMIMYCFVLSKTFWIHTLFFKTKQWCMFKHNEWFSCVEKTDSKKEIRIVIK